MPVTGFHIGIGALAKGCSPGHFSFVVFCVTQVAIDLESGYLLFFGGWPLHRGIHTLIGATLVCAGVVIVSRRLSIRRGPPSTKVRMLGRFVYEDVACLRSPTGLVATVTLSVLGHVIPDAVMHGDVRAFAPLADGNPFLAALSHSTLHWALVISGALGGVAMLVRWARRSGNRG